jgi:Uma2 family endonuclease
MTTTATLPELDPTRPPPPEYLPDYEQFVTEDDAPVDNFFSEKQQRLLTEPLYSADVAARLGRPLLAAANVGIFFGEGEPAIVPDVLLSLDVRLAEDLWPKPNRSYFIWRFAKPPDAVVEIVSNREGGETDRKRTRYAQLGIGYYIIFDPQRLLGDERLRCNELRGRTYMPCEGELLRDVGLGARLWEGEYEGVQAVWLRWCDQDGNLIPTGAELAAQERARAEAERQRAEAERQRAEAERQRAERLAARLRAMGIDPDAEE